MCSGTNDPPSDVSISGNNGINGTRCTSRDVLNVSLFKYSLQAHQFCSGSKPNTKFDWLFYDFLNMVQCISDSSAVRNKWQIAHIPIRRSLIAENLKILER